jgi:hypothetical protein
MRVQINESWGNHQPGGINSLFASQPLRFDSDDLPIRDSHVRHHISVGFWVHDSSIEQNQVIRALWFHLLPFFLADA